MIKKNLTLYISVLVVLVISLLVLGNIIYSLLITAALAYMVFVIIKSKARDEIKYFKIDSSYEFTNFMNIQMLSTDNAYEGYQAIEAYLSKDFQNIDGEYFIEQINEIANQYALIGFQIYANNMLLYANNGGDYNKLLSAPSELCQKTKIYYRQLKSKKRNKLMEIFILYFLWAFVMIFLKIGLGQYFNQMLKNAAFETMMAIIMVLGFGTFALACNAYYQNHIGGL